MTWWEAALALGGLGLALIVWAIARMVAAERPPRCGDPTCWGSEEHR